MAKIAISISLLISLISAGLIDLYPATAKVICIQSDVVVVETYSGNQFAFSGAEDYCVNDTVSMLMYGCGTPEVKDDIIVKCRYSGYGF